MGQSYAKIASDLGTQNDLYDREIFLNLDYNREGEEKCRFLTYNKC